MHACRSLPAGPLVFGRGNAFAMSPTPGYIDQSPDALRLTLVEGAFDTSPYQLLKSCRRVLHGIQVTATVIGASHIISFHTDSLALHEVFACEGPEDVSYWSLDELVSAPVERQFPGLRYEFSARRVDWEDPEPPELERLVRAVTHRAAMSSSFGVVEEFPQGDLLVTPKTVIFGNDDGCRRGLVIETAHSYPNVQGLVLSRTSLSTTGRYS